MHLGHVLKFAHDHGATTLAHVETILREQLGLRLNQVAVHHPALDGIAGGGDQVAPPTSAPAAAAGDLDYDRLAEAIVGRVVKGIEKVTSKVVPNALSVLGTVLELSGNGNVMEQILAEQQAEEAKLNGEDESPAAAGASSEMVPDNVVTLPTAARAETQPEDPTPAG
jgi:hypothetical protein